MEIRDRLALALDVDDLVAANRLAKELRPYFGVVKIGLELFAANGPDAVMSMTNLGYKVFLDLKLHDIPTTVGRAARVIGAFGVSYVTMHAFGGIPMLRAGVEGLAEGSAGAGVEQPIALAVTILTSDSGAPPHILGGRVRNALEARCGGVVCAEPDIAEARQLGPNLTIVVPGMRMQGDAADDQARAGTPRSAIDAGASLLVIGRSVTAAPDRQAAAEAIHKSLAATPV